MEEIYKGLFDDWEMYIEYKMFEFVFYLIIIQDWGLNLFVVMYLGFKCKFLVDLGYYVLNINIEMIVLCLIQFKKLGGFYFNDSKYGDDDLDSGLLYFYQQFLIFNELVDVEYCNQEGFGLVYMFDQLYNVIDLVESLINFVIEVQCLYVKVLLVNCEVFYGFQEGNDVLMVLLELKNVFNLDVFLILVMVCLCKGFVIDLLVVYCQVGYCKVMVEVCLCDFNVIGFGIV